MSPMLSLVRSGISGERGWINRCISYRLQCPPMFSAAGLQLRSLPTMLTTDAHAGSIPIHLVHEDGFEAWRGGQDEVDPQLADRQCIQG